MGMNGFQPGCHQSTAREDGPFFQFNTFSTGDSAIELTNITTASTTNADATQNSSGRGRSISSEGRRMTRSQSLESRQSQFNLQSTVEIGNAALASTHQKTGPKGVRSTKRKRSSSTTTEKKNQPKKRKISISSMLNGLEKEFKVFQNYFHHHSEPNDEVALDIKIWKTGGILICLYFRDSAEMVMIEENSFGNHAEGVDLQRLINLWKNIERVKSRKEELFPTLQNWNNFKKEERTTNNIPVDLVTSNNASPQLPTEQNAPSDPQDPIHRLLQRIILEILTRTN